MSPHDRSATSDRFLVTAIAALAIGYAMAIANGWIQHAGSAGHISAQAAHDSAGGTSPESGGSAAERHTPLRTHGLWTVAPFVCMLLAIALLPLWKVTSDWWEKNRNRFLVAVVLAAITLAYYGLAHGMESVSQVLEHAFLDEYIPFIVLLFSLYTISGGIRIYGDLIARPAVNCAFLAAGGILASFIGTTGAAMLLIRALLETNRERHYVQHTVIFFIFVVCNCGGCLLPIGDPPLFLGYLQGVSFLWTLWNLWLPWLVVNAVLIAIYFVIDAVWFYRHETARDVALDRRMRTRLVVEGIWPHVLLLLGVVLAVAFLDPTKALPRASWHPWPFLREVVQLSLVAVSLVLGRSELRQANRFNYHAILEVAALFVGIFITMQPALEILHEEGPSLGIDTPQEFFWTTGSLSSVLDNAPTYLVFYQTAATLFPDAPFAHAVSQPGKANHVLMAISLGAVFMGAMTYIGNGPNFMVRAIAEEMGVAMPSFFGYVVRYSVPVLLPVFAFVSWMFL